jgi:rod shape-determining protein MreD
MMRLALSIIFLIVFVALQISLGPIIEIADVAPHFALLFVFFVAFTFGQTYGIWIGFFSGLLCDIFDASHFGLNMMLFICIGFFIGSLKQKFYRDNLLLEVGIFAVTLFLYEIIYMIVIWQFPVGIFLLNILRYVIPRIIYSMVISLLLLPLLKRVPIFAPRN